MSSTQVVNSRFVALKICLNVIVHGRSLSATLNNNLTQLADPRARAFTQNLVLGSLRWHIRLDAIANQLIKKPLRAKDTDVKQLILLGLYQIIYMDTPEHAAVAETVGLVKKLKKNWAKGFVNSVLRNFLRDQPAILAAVDLKSAHKYSHPQWFTKAIKKAYPDLWQTILNANNKPAPIILRTNKMLQTRATLINLLAEQAIEAYAHSYGSQAIALTQGTNVSLLPTFINGGFSVQDAAAQLATDILQPQANEFILDACAAPGGKTCHLLESSNNQANLVALEKDPNRIDRLTQNLHRLALNATVKVGDASKVAQWWDGKLFDKILLDAPCSATGIIRRHPDIKWHRTAEDINALVLIQAQILTALWETLKVGGKLLYATCSVLPQENSEQLKNFINKTANAKQITLDVSWGIVPTNKIGRQILPCTNDKTASMDGFYYCLLEKTP